MLQSDSSRTFQSTLPARGATFAAAFQSRAGNISIHAPRTGSDAPNTIRSHLPYTFQSTLPARGATLQAHQGLQHQGISIHAPRTGSDADGLTPQRIQIKFQSTLPARGATPADRQRFCTSVRFQSTLPARGATGRMPESAPARDFNPRSPHGERPVAAIQYQADRRISIHAPRTGSDVSRSRLEYSTTDFNPRSPHGERRPKTSGKDERLDFNPRSPHGERLCCAQKTFGVPRFQSTLPARGATCDPCPCCHF